MNASAHACLSARKYRPMHLDYCAETRHLHAHMNMQDAENTALQAGNRPKHCSMKELSRTIRHGRPPPTAFSIQVI